MRLTLALHILAGGLGLLFGYAALFTQKGAAFHRKADHGFIYAMLTMAMCGMAIAAIEHRGPAANIPAALTTGYLAITALSTLRPGPRWLQIVGMVVAFGVGCLSMMFGCIPAFPFFFGTIGLLGSASDFRMLRTGGGVQGVALLIAAMSFFLGQAKVFPKEWRNPALLSLPVLVVLLAMLYWLWRVHRPGYSLSAEPR